MPNRAELVRRLAALLPKQRADASKVKEQEKLVDEALTVR